MFKDKLRPISTASEFIANKHKLQPKPIHSISSCIVTPDSIMVTMAKQKSISRLDQLSLHRH
jgi:hypothetical protein